jgi:hypothetical protein
MNNTWPWITLILLGAYHGINPAMGWLFAVALGLQERSRAAVLRAFAPIALGHAASVAAVVGLVAVAQAFIPSEVLRLAGAAALIGYGGYKLFLRAAHPRWVGMRVNFRDLTAWSFLMSTAHGAGLMLVPVLLRLAPAAPVRAAHVMPDGTVMSAAAMMPAGHAGHMMLAGAAPSANLAAVGLHTAAMFLVMAVVAVVVYEKLGLAILRRVWLNLDLLWAAALIVAGALTLALG